MLRTKGGRRLYTAKPLLSFPNQGRKRRDVFIDGLKVFSLLANAADVKSLVIHPYDTTHAEMSPEQLEAAGIYQNTIRLSIGTEHIDDIIWDQEQGFAAAAKK